MYKTEGMNLFNVSNLLRDAEKIFRLSVLSNQGEPSIIPDKEITLMSARSKLLQLENKPF